MAALDVFLPDILVHAPGAPDPFVRQSIIRAAREWCQRTFGWKVWIACAADAPPDSQYAFTVPTDAELVRLERVTLAGRPIDVVNFRAPERDYVTYATEEAQGAITSDLATFTLLGTVTGTLQAFVSLQPTLAAASVPDILASRYMESIAKGAAARLLLTEGATFAKPQMGALLRQEFLDAIGRATTDVMKGHTKATPRNRVLWC